MPNEEKLAICGKVLAGATCQLASWHDSVHHAVTGGGGNVWWDDLFIIPDSVKEVEGFDDDGEAYSEEMSWGKY